MQSHICCDLSRTRIQVAFGRACTRRAEQHDTDVRYELSVALSGHVHLLINKQPTGTSVTHPARQEDIPVRGAHPKPAAMSYSLFPLCVLGLIALSSSCYIQNCPRGGKRALPETGIRQCMSCGPGDRGHCFGPSICCGEGLGCLLGSPETAHCVEENYLLTPCQAGGRPCGSEGGRCAASGLCCNSESCAVDPDCLGEAEASDLAHSSAGRLPAELLLRLLHVAARGQTEY